MGKRKAALAGRAWNLLRLVLLWARKGGVFKRGLPPVRNYIKSLRGASRSGVIHFGEREFSIDETPIFHFKMSRPRSARMLRFPCINPAVDFDFDLDDDDDVIFVRGRRSSGRRWGSTDVKDQKEDAEEEVGSEGPVNGGGGDELAYEASSHAPEEDVEDEETCIDAKAEEFIAKFYARMKLQRQISLLQYNDRSTD